MNYENLAALINSDMPISALTAEVVRLQDENQRMRDSILLKENADLYAENQRMRDALEIIEHTLATLRGTK